MSCFDGALRLGKRRFRIARISRVSSIESVV